MAFWRWAVFMFGISILVLVAIFGLLRREPSTAAWIVFVSEIHGKGFELVRIQPETGQIRSLSQMSVEIRSPIWSPDGQWIAFSAGDKIFRVKPNGKDLEALSDTPVNAFYLSWSPDGEWIYFEHIENGIGNLYRIRADGASLEQLYNMEITFSAPTLSPDGHWLAVTSSIDGNFNIYKLRADGSEMQRLTVVEARDSHPIWSSDSEQIAFLSNRDGEYDIYIMRSDGSDVRSVVTKVGFKQPLLFSGDNRYLVYLVTNVADCVETLDLQTGHVYQLQCALQPTNIDLSPSGDRLLFDPRNFNGNSPLLIVHPDGSQNQILNTDGYLMNSSPVWSPAYDLAWSGWKLGLGGIVLLAMAGFWGYRSL